MTELNIVLAQFNPHVGDIAGNAARIGEACDAHPDADLLIFGELAISGYSPEDLVLKPFFVDRCMRAAQELAGKTTKDGPALLVGCVWRDQGEIYNAALLIEAGEIRHVVKKRHLPNYGVFDELRVFTAATQSAPVAFRGLQLGVMICEDMWYADVAADLKNAGADILVVLNGSPFEHDKLDVREDHAAARVAETGLGLIYVNQVGGQDELVFDGSSFVHDPPRDKLLHAPSFVPAMISTRWQKTDAAWSMTQAPESAPEYTQLQAIYQALVLGLRDYVDKNGFPGVVLGMSGGIDSALSAAVAVDALGAERVWCVMMPSPYTSQESLDDAAECARLIGAKLDTINIGPAMQAFDTMLAPHFAGRAPDTTEENIQARARGISLMALSNKFGHMVLSTGNKSEMSVGYATLYGDMCGGYSVLKDVYKTVVYKLSAWRNDNRPDDALGPDGTVIPQNIITKAPTAELKPNQTDQDSLPPYDVLDDILECLIEGDMGVTELTARGHDRATVSRIWRMLDLAEYKRRQAPPGVKISHRAFGRDRRYPITNALRRLIDTD